MTETPVLTTVADGVMTITLNRPAKLNALTEDMRRQWCDAFDIADADDGVRAVIVTGAGRAFCAGADISAGTSGFIEAASAGPYRDGGGVLALRIFDSKKPVIGAINGPAVGIGIAATLPMDYRIASTNAKFGFVYTQRGIGPEGCSSWFLAKLVGVQHALDWMLTGRVFSADEALATGLVRSLHAPDELLPEAHRIAHAIADHTAPLSVSITRRMIWNLLATEHPRRAHEVESEVIPFLVSTADAQEGVAAFLAKRPACFTGQVSTDIPAALPLA
jgi:enoyl-CoA hydratase/carnithine racemase